MSEEGLDNAVPKWALDALQAHPSFHGSISKMEAVTKLIESGQNCYLTRYSEFHKACIISVFQISSNGEEMLHHIQLEIPRDSSKRYKIAGTAEEFDNISMLLETYKDRRIQNINGLGECLQSNIWQSSIDLVSVVHASSTLTETFIILSPQIPDDELLTEDHASMQDSE